MLKAMDVIIARRLQSMIEIEFGVESFLSGASCGCQTLQFI